MGPRDEVGLLDEPAATLAKVDVKLSEWQVNSHCTTKKIIIHGLEKKGDIKAH